MDESPQHGIAKPVKADSWPYGETAGSGGKDAKQTTVSGMKDPAHSGKVVNFTVSRNGATKGKLPEKTAAQDTNKQVDKAKDAAKPHRCPLPRLTKRLPTKQNHSLGTKHSKLRSLLGKVLLPKRRPWGLQSSYPSLGTLPVV